MAGLIPRDYQIEAANAAVAGNRIVNLPTGAGKTLIAALVHEQLKSRMTLVCCASVAVIEQHTQFFHSRGIRNVLVDTAAGLKAKIFDYGGVGDENDFDADDVNARMLEEKRAAIARKIADVQLIVFDECHHAIGHHPYVKLCELFFQFKEASDFRVLGLTASFIHGQFENISKKRQRLEDNLRAKLWSPENFVVKNLDKHFYKVEYAEPKNLVLSKRDIEARSFEMMRHILRKLPYGMAAIVSREVSKSAFMCYYILGDAGWSFFLRDGLVPYLEAKLRQKAEYVVRDAVQQHELNRRYADEHDGHTTATATATNNNGTNNANAQQQYISHSLASASSHADSSAPSLPTTSDLESQRAEYLVPLHRYLQQSIPVIPQFSPKVDSLVEILLSCTSSKTETKYDPVFGTTELKQVEELDTSLIFVERAVLCIPLAKIIELRTGKTCRPVMGVQSMNTEVRNSTLNAFKDGRVRVIVATSSLEEGIDVADCKVVVRFDYFNSVRSHIQGSGRARHKDAKIFYFEQEPEVEEYKASLLTLAAVNRDLQIPDLQAQQRRVIPALQEEEMLGKRGTAASSSSLRDGAAPGGRTNKSTPGQASSSSMGSIGGGQKKQNGLESSTSGSEDPGTGKDRSEIETTIKSQKYDATNVPGVHRNLKEPPHLRVREYPTLSFCGVGHRFDREETQWDVIANKSQRVVICSKCRRATVVIKSRVFGQGRKKKERFYCFGGRDNDWVCMHATAEELEKAKAVTMDDLLRVGGEVGTHDAKAALLQAAEKSQKTAPVGEESTISPAGVVVGAGDGVEAAAGEAAVGAEAEIVPSSDRDHLEMRLPDSAEQDDEGFVTGGEEEEEAHSASQSSSAAPVVEESAQDDGAKTNANLPRQKQKGQGKSKGGEKSQASSTSENKGKNYKDPQTETNNKKGTRNGKKNGKGKQEAKRPATQCATVTTGSDGRRTFNLLEGPPEGPIVSLRKEKEVSSVQEMNVVTGGSRVADRLQVDQLGGAGYQHHNSKGAPGYGYGGGGGGHYTKGHTNTQGGYNNNYGGYNNTNAPSSTSSGYPNHGYNSSSYPPQPTAASSHQGSYPPPLPPALGGLQPTALPVVHQAPPEGDPSDTITGNMPPGLEDYVPAVGGAVLAASSEEGGGEKPPGSGTLMFSPAKRGENASGTYTAAPDRKAAEHLLETAGSYPEEKAGEDSIHQDAVARPPVDDIKDPHSTINTSEVVDGLTSTASAKKKPLPVIEKPNPSLPPTLPPVLQEMIGRTQSLTADQHRPPMPRGSVPKPPPGLLEGGAGRAEIHADLLGEDDDHLLEALEEFGEETNPAFEQVQ